MPDVAYTYRVKVGSHEWEAATSDTADYGPVDGLQIIRKLRDSDLWPAPEDPAECRFQLVVASTADVPDVQLGAAVAVEYYTERPSEPGLPYLRQSFYGRVAELTSSPHDLGTLLTLNCLDYTADLREPTVGGAVAYPAEAVWSRVFRVMAEAGYNVGVEDYPPGSTIFPSVVGPQLAARDPEAANLYDLVDGYLAQWAADYGYASSSANYRGRARMGLVPSVSNDQLFGFFLHPYFERPIYTGPLRLELVGGVYTAVPADNPAAAPRTQIIPATQLDFSAVYAQTKADSPTRVTVAGDKFTVGEAQVTADLGVTPPIVATIDGVQLTNLADATTLAALYLPEYLPADRWVADTFLRHLELGGAAAANANQDTIPPLGTLILVSLLDAAQNPTGRSWFAGQLSGYTFTIADKRPTVAFQLRRSDFAPPNSGVVTWQSAVLAGVTWANIDPTMTWDDLRLVRGTAA